MVRSIPRSVVYVALLSGIGCIVGNQQTCATGPSSTVDQEQHASSSPTPTPSPSPTATPSPSPSPVVVAESCDIEFMTLSPSDQTVNPTTGPGRLSLTPYQTFTCGANDARVECLGKQPGERVKHEISAACNDPRANEIIWTSSSSLVTVAGGSFEPAVNRSAGGNPATVFATLRRIDSNPVTVR